MPQLEGGDIKSVSQKASEMSFKLKSFIDEGYTILSIVPSCTLMLKFEWPLLLPENTDVKKLSKNTKDICEFLAENINDDNKHLLKPVDKENNVSLHISCHSRAQNIGQKATELLRLIPQLKLDVIERCSGHGGSWGIKKNNFEMAIKVGKPVARKVIQYENEYVVSECPLAGTHIQQGVNKIDNSKNVKVLSHPLEILAKSMSIMLKEK
jgi:glycerol-3-phosphate dehydrogenase subunit C